MAMEALPAELLYMIISNLDLLDDKGFQLSSLAAMHPAMPCFLTSGYAIHNLDTSIFNVLRVSHLWRSIALNIVFKENASKWTDDRTDMKLRRLRVLRIWLAGCKKPRTLVHR